MAMVGVDDNSLQTDSQLELVGLVWRSAAICWWVCIHQLNRMNSQNTCGHEDNVANIDAGIIIISKH